MEIYIVQQGDTLELIANKFNTTSNKILLDNELINPNELVPGQNIIITYPEQTYVIQEGDTLESISNAFQIPLQQLLRNNPHLSNNKVLITGDTLVISYKTDKEITTHGFAYPYIQKDILLKTLPYLTYITVFNYSMTKEGEMVSFGDDTDIIQTAKEFQVIPLLFTTFFSNIGKTSREAVFEILSNEKAQNRLIENLLLLIKNKGYMGINLTINFINISNQHLYIETIQRISTAMKANGYLFFLTINPNIEEVNGKILFEQVNYTAISQLVDHIVFLHFYFGTYNGPPTPVTSIRNLRTFMDYAADYIPLEKLSIGFPILGYDWALPFNPDSSRANSLTIETSLNLAKQSNSTINFDIVSQTPYFYYHVPNIVSPTRHIVWFVDASSINALLKLVDDFGVSGTGIWNIMMYMPQLWLVINPQYNIKKLLPDKNITSLSYNKQHITNQVLHGCKPIK